MMVCKTVQLNWSKMAKIIPFIGRHFLSQKLNGNASCFTRNKNPYLVICLPNHSPAVDGF